MHLSDFFVWPHILYRQPSSQLASRSIMRTKSYKVSGVRAVGQLSITDVDCVQPISSMRKEAINIDEFYHPNLIPDTPSKEVGLTCWLGDVDCVQPISSMGFIMQPTALILDTFCDFLFIIVLEAAHEKQNDPHLSALFTGILLANGWQKRNNRNADADFCSLFWISMDIRQP